VGLILGAMGGGTQRTLTRTKEHRLLVTSVVVTGGRGLPDCVRVRRAGWTKGAPEGWERGRSEQADDRVDPTSGFVSHAAELVRGEPFSE
jgi:hypothetical protein